MKRLTLGDGINDVRVTPGGQIWVSYFDEGVFGNYGWSSPGPTPIGAPGLVRFDLEGQITFAFDGNAAGTDDICDAYALNVPGDADAWVYFYTEFPLVNVQGAQYRVWNLGEAGARAMAVRGQQVLLFGDYGHKNLLRKIDLGPDGNAKVIDQVPAVDEHGRLFSGVQVFGVGDKLYFLDGWKVHVLEGW